ncbi:DUF2637 domain-containing protein [Microbacterium enclense]|uniref:DUF2637 domain-containing protein n=1 Tax=Microbacterium enclense TaxID=993073 RepID=UPI003F81E5BE
MAGFAITLVLVIMTASYVFSFAAIMQAAEWTGAPEWTRPLAPVFIDGPILTYTLTYAVFRHRGEPAQRTLFFLYLFTSISTVVNIAHALTFNQFEWSHPQTWFGALIAAAAPLGALLASEEVIRLALAHPINRSGADRQPEAHLFSRTVTDEEAPFDPDADRAPEEELPRPLEVFFEDVPEYLDPVASGWER